MLWAKTKVVQGVVGVLAVALLVGLSACQTGASGPSGAAPAAGLSANAADVAKARSLTPDDVSAALKTYVPGGKYDDYYMFASGGQSGQVFVFGLPSMRLLKTIAVFTPESWQGYGQGEEDTMKILDEGKFKNNPILWGDTHHPALSETNGQYDGQYLFINDKANGRIAVIDLRDFRTKQIVKNPVMINNHGGAFVTPNTDYIIDPSQYAVPLDFQYAPISEYKEKYRGLITYWKFDRQKGRIDPAQSFAIEVPPYWQDLCDAGKLVSDGWAFCGSFNSEMATGGIEEGKPPFESGTAQRDMDYLHVMNWKKAEEVVKAGKAQTINGMKVIRLPTAVSEGILYLAPEPKSPHGSDVTPKGDYIVVGGKLDPHVTIFSFKKMQDAIAKQSFDRDSFGVPVFKFNEVMEAQVELGLGPLHTVFDDQGYAYTSLFLDSGVVKWSLGAPYRTEGGWKRVEHIPTQYNLGHLTAVEGDTVSPGGKFVVALNKWSVDRFLPVGPLHPQNLQLIDITGSKMQVLYDAPVGVGEPHYAQIIKAERLKPWKVYPETGWNARAQAKDPNATTAGKEKIERRGKTVEIWMRAMRSNFNPERITVKKGDHVIWHITSIERTEDATHGFALPGYNINLSIDPGETVTFEFDVTESGVFTYYCTEFCSALHLEMAGYFMVEP
ncbi:MAG: Sec-dependent nitrous-oxide reductase [Dehalococcoidia bacterium]|nr:Sec-dependent nitrous-oxide reductase [Dehalococcoidia bacterium]